MFSRRFLVKKRFIERFKPWAMIVWSRCSQQSRVAAQVQRLSPPCPWNVSGKRTCTPRCARVPGGTDGLIRSSLSDATSWQTWNRLGI